MSGQAVVFRAPLWGRLLVGSRGCSLDRRQTFELLTMKIRNNSWHSPTQQVELHVYMRFSSLKLRPDRLAFFTFRVIFRLTFFDVWRPIRPGEAGSLSIWREQRSRPSWKSISTCKFIYSLHSKVRIILYTSSCNSKNTSITEKKQRKNNKQ